MRGMEPNRWRRLWSTATLVVTLAVLCHGALMAADAHAARPSAGHAQAASAGPHATTEVAVTPGHDPTIADGDGQTPGHGPDGLNGCGDTLIVALPTAFAAGSIPAVAPAAVIQPDGVSLPPAACARRPVPSAPPGARRALLQVYRI